MKEGAALLAVVPFAVLSLFSCSGKPTQPAELAKVWLELVNSAGTVGTNAITDSTGHTVRIGLLPDTDSYDLIDSARLVISVNDSTVYTKNYNITSNAVLWDSLTISSSRDYGVAVVTYRKDGSSSTATAHIKVKWIPAWTSNGKPSSIVQDSLSLVEALSRETLFALSAQKLYESTNGGRDFSDIPDFDTLGMNSIKLVSKDHLVVYSNKPYATTCYFYNVFTGSILQFFGAGANPVTVTINGAVVGYNYVDTTISNHDTTIQDSYRIVSVDANDAMDYRSLSFKHSAASMFPVLLRTMPITIVALNTPLYSTGQFTFYYYTLYDPGDLPIRGSVSSASTWDALDVPTQQSYLSTNSSGQTMCMNYGTMIKIMNMPVYYRIKTIYSSDILPDGVQPKDIIPFDTSNAWVLGTDGYAYYNSDGFMAGCYARSSNKFEKLLRTFNASQVIGIPTPASTNDSIFVSNLP